MDNNYKNIDINKLSQIEADSRDELAAKAGIKVPEDGYWGDVPSKVCGIVGGAKGGEKVRTAIENYEKMLAEKSYFQNRD